MARGYCRGDIRLRIALVAAALVAVEKLNPMVSFQPAAVSHRQPPAGETSQGGAENLRQGLIWNEAQLLAAAAAAAEVATAQPARVQPHKMPLQSYHVAAPGPPTYNPVRVYCTGYCGLGDGLGSAESHSISALLFNRPKVTCYTNISKPTQDDILLVSLLVHYWSTGARQLLMRCHA
jgi:hypothetical protein